MLLCRSLRVELGIFQDCQSSSPSLDRDPILSHSWLIFICPKVLSMSISFFPFHVPLLPPYDLPFPKQRKVLTCPGPSPVLTWRGPPPPPGLTSLVIIIMSSRSITGRSYCCNCRFDHSLHFVTLHQIQAPLIGNSGLPKARQLGD